MSRVQIGIDAGISVRIAHALAGTVATAVSAAGSSQSDATLIAACNNLITTASAGQGVRLPSFNAGDIIIANGTAVDVLVYPVSGAKLNNAAANAAITLPAGLAVLVKSLGPTAYAAVYASRAGLGLATTDSPQFAAVNIGHASDTTLARTGAGDIAVEGNALYRAGGTDVPVTDGGTGASTAAAARTNLGVGLVLLASGTVSAAATLDIVLTSHTAYRGIVVFLSGFLPATDGANLYMRVSTDGGSSYDASGYNYSLLELSETASGGSGSGSAAQMLLMNFIGNGAAEGYNGRIELLNQTSTAFWGRISHQGAGIDNQATPAARQAMGSAAREATQDTDAIRFLFSSGDIASGSYALYGFA